MRELILISSYILSAFIPVIIKHQGRGDMSIGLFWTAWLIGLVGAFLGGVFGVMLLSELGLDFGFWGDIVPAILGSFILTGLFFIVREIPEDW